jgi:two-component system, chemotaxis family, chemotaxis protein CheY
MKILSVDDSATIRKIIRGTVEILGHEFLGAKNGKESLGILETEFKAIGLILLDWNMPEMDGLEVLTAIRLDDRFKEIPVMMLTTESERAKISKAIAAGANHYLTKPFATEDLAARIMECLGLGLDL